VDADVADKLVEKEEKIESALTTDETSKIKAIFEKAINRPNMKVEIEGQTADEQPVTVTMDEFMRRMKEMAQLGGGMSFYGSIPDNYKVAINGNHKLVNKILKAVSEEEQSKLAKQAFDLALLSQGMLTGAELTDFVNRSLELI
jgi:molecular chaperone HtpG